MIENFLFASCGQNGNGHLYISGPSFIGTFCKKINVMVQFHMSLEVSISRKTTQKSNNSSIISRYAWKNIKLYSFNWCWNLICLKQLALCVKVLEQYEHLKGFSPVWVRICFCITSFLWCTFGQIGHENSWGPSLIGTFWNK